MHVDLALFGGMEIKQNIEIIGKGCYSTSESTECQSKKKLSKLKEDTLYNKVDYQINKWSILFSIMM